MKYLFLYILIVPVLVVAQNNDPDILVKNKVYEVKKYQKIHGFIENNDTCLIDEIRLDKRGNVIYHMVDWICIGWKKKEESIMEYEKGRMVSLKTLKDGKHSSTSRFTYGKYDDPEKIMTVNEQGKDSTLMTMQYFRTKKGRIDSSITTTKMKNKSIQITKNVVRYNEDGEVVQMYTLDRYGEPLKMTRNEIGDDKLVKSTSHISYDRNEFFIQTFYEYDQDKRIERTINTVNQKQEYFYSKDGLITKVLSYNPKGVLEIEYIYSYTFYK